MGIKKTTRPGARPLGSVLEALRFSACPRRGGGITERSSAIMTDVQQSANAAQTNEPTYDSPNGGGTRAPRDPSEPLGVRELFEAGVHFGHQTKRWNPKMRPFIYGARSGIHIVDLDQTGASVKRAFDFVSDTVSRGGSLLFVGTKTPSARHRPGRSTPCRHVYVTNRCGRHADELPHHQGRSRSPTHLERMREDGTYCSCRRRKPCSSRRSARASRSTSAA